MGPLVLTSGRPARAGRPHPHHRRASMGPLVLTSGRRCAATPAPGTPGSFNGAAGSHQRKGMTVRGVDADCHCFNGAAGSHQRKGVRVKWRGLEEVHASMGPLVLTSGRQDGGLWTRWCRFASMGPLVLTSGRLLELLGRDVGQPALQWGRWFSPAEGGLPRCLCTSASCFNGAAGSHQRKVG